MPGFTRAGDLLEARIAKNVEQSNLRNIQQLVDPNLYVASHSISQFGPNMSNMQWSIRVRFEKKTPIRPFANRLTGRPGQIMRALVYDRSLFIEIVAFDDMCNICDQTFNIAYDPTTEYIVRNGTIKTIFNERLSAWPNTLMSSCYEITLTQASQIIPIPHNLLDIDEGGVVNSSSNAGNGEAERQNASLDLYKRSEGKPIETVNARNSSISSNNKAKQMSYTVVDLRNRNFTKLNKLIFNAPESFVNIFCVIDEVHELKTITKQGKTLINNFS